MLEGVVIRNSMFTFGHHSALKTDSLLDDKISDSSKFKAFVDNNLFLDHIMEVKKNRAVTKRDLNTPASPLIESRILYRRTQG